MEPVSPVLGEEFQSRELTFAKDQKQYFPIPVHRNKYGILISRWRLNEVERAAIAAGADIYLSSYTRNEPLLPCAIEVGDCNRDIIAKARDMGLLSQWECETCGVEFAEYINGCPHCEQRGVRSAVRNVSRAGQAGD